MGLDNAIMAKGKTKAGNDYLEMIKNKFNLEVYDEEYEIAYWRKCWNIRSHMLMTIEPKCDKERSDDYEFFFGVDVLENITEELKYFLNEDNWELGGSSIWTWIEMLPCIADQIRIMRVILEDIECGVIDAEDLDFRFYDSY